MAFWLLKSEPETWSWDEMVAAGALGTEWDGVRNYLARNNMRKMNLGDLCFFYHSGSERSIVGIVEVCAEAHADSTDDSGVWDCVDVKPLKPLKKIVTLAQIKAVEKLVDMPLVTHPRLSVQPVTALQWHLICKMSGVLV